jgi:hypothetical protein
MAHCKAGRVDKAQAVLECPELLFQAL